MKLEKAKVHKKILFFIEIDTLCIKAFLKILRQQI